MSAIGGPPTSSPIDRVLAPLGRGLSKAGTAIGNAAKGARDIFLSCIFGSSSKTAEVSMHSAKRGSFSASREETQALNPDLRAQPTQHTTTDAINRAFPAAKTESPEYASFSKAEQKVLDSMSGIKQALRSEKKPTQAELDSAIQYTEELRQEVLRTPVKDIVAFTKNILEAEKAGRESGVSQADKNQKTLELAKDFVYRTNNIHDAYSDDDLRLIMQKGGEYLSEIEKMADDPLAPPAVTDPLKAQIQGRIKDAEETLEMRKYLKP